MKKSDFVAEVAKKTGLSQAKSNEYLTAVLGVITDTLKSGDKVTLTGFGSFEVRDRAARMVTDIRTKEKKQTPASKYPAFSSGAVLKAAVKPAASKPAQPDQRLRTGRREHEGRRCPGAADFRHANRPGYCHGRLLVPAVRRRC